MHLLCVALKEAPAPTNKQRVSRKHRFLALVFHVIADAVLRVAGGVDALDGDVAEAEGRVVGWSPGHALAVFAADNGQVGRAQALELEESVRVS